VGIPSDVSVDQLDSPDVIRWIPQQDLLNSTSLERHYVVEMDNEGVAHLRFGDGELGQQPAAGTQFLATYRVGNGPTGNIGSETLSYVVFRGIQQSGITLQPHNPFPAQGGTPPEPLEEVKRYAPHTFRKKLQRAITAQDYADIVMRDFPARVQRAAAILHWTGSWHEVLVAIDPLGTKPASDFLLEEIEQHLYRYRRMGHDVVVKPAAYVPLDIVLMVCVQPDYLRGHVKAALLEVFSNRLRTNGQCGFFHPDNLTFGIGIALSQLIATAQAVSGVASVKVIRLQRLGVEDNSALASGLLSLSSLEIARLDNDPNFPENGKFELIMGGGR
jgi:predicted phage baseplate assembly protein